MIILRIVFIILSLIALACAGKGLAGKRRNIGFLITSFLIAGSDIIYMFLIGVQDAKSASKVLLPYYILHAWFLLAIMVMILLVDRYKRVWLFSIPSAILCVYQTYLVICQYRGSRIFSFQKRIYFRSAFWVAVEDSKNTGIFFSFRSYQFASYINLFLILCVLILCVIHSYKIFRSRYFIFMIMSVVYCVSEILIVYFSAPVWISGLAYNLIGILGLYLTDRFARKRLEEWSLDHFADDMSDGLVLYDRYDDLIHLNEMVKRTLSAELLADFKERSNLEAWISERMEGEENRIVPYVGSDREYYFKVTIQKIEERNSQFGTLYILHDTTDSMRRIQAMEKANEELERVSRMKSDFLANMSHEIRTPMNAVIGMAELAMRENDLQMIQNYLLQIQSSGRNLLNIINDILDYSKIESGKMEIIEENYVPFEELSEISNVLYTRIGEKPLELFMMVEGILPHQLKGDAMRIRQVLINLANNAIKFTREGMVKIQIVCEPQPDGIVNMTYHVIDTGIGIKEEDLGKLFVSFQQVDSKRNRSVEGTGLGLAISQKLVEAMGGKIGVASEYGKGSDFWFTIPQKVIDETNDITIENPSDKYAYVFAEEKFMEEAFSDELKNVGVDSHAISSLSEYTPSGKKEYLFFRPYAYDDIAKEFLDIHKEITGIVLVDAGDEFTSDRSNLHLMVKPETTMSMVNVLNDRFDVKRQDVEDKVFQADFTAPEAKILIVDDNAINLTIAGGLMEPLKVQQDTAGGGQEAIDKVRKQAYDIVFMDHMMPEIDGVDAAKTIRAEGDAIHQPVIIALSANVMEEARNLFKEAGMEDFVGKPIDVRKLAAAIRKWLPAEKIVEGAPDDLSGEAPEQKEIVYGIQSELLDTETALHALGSAALYDKIAEEYYRSGEDRLNSILDAYEKEDWADYTIKVHALKSSSRQIGAMELGTMAEALEKAGKADDIDTIRSDTEGTMQAFRQILKELEKYYWKEEEDNADKPIIDKETLEGYLKELETGCDDLDLDGIEEVGNQLKGYAYEEDIQGLMKDLYKAIADIDTDECMELVNQIRNKME